MISEPINAVIVLEEDVDRSVLEAALPPAEQLSVTGVVHGLDAGKALDETSTAQLLIVACSGTLEDAADVIRRWRSVHADRPVVALCESPPDYAVQALFKAGADDVVKLPETPERVMFTLEKALARHERRDGEGGRSEVAPMICVVGPKGGAGKTVTASNLAVALANRGCRTALVDLDLQFGDIGLALGLYPERTAYDLATSGGALDAEKLEAYLVVHGSGTRALLAPVRPDQASAVSTDLMRAVYALLRATHDVVVVDTPPDFTPQVITAVDVSSHVCIVGTLDSLSLKNTKLGLETLDLMGYDRGAVSFVLNRANTNVGLTVEDVEAIIGRRPDVLVPSDREVPRSLNEGAPIVVARKRSSVAAAFRELAGRYLTDAPGRNGDGSEQASANGSAPSNDEPATRRRFRLVRGASDSEE
jgi:pilus assembly protein CpaE